MTAPESIASMDIEGTTTIVCGSWLNRSMDFHNGTSFFCSRSISTCEPVAILRSGISQRIKAHLVQKSSALAGVTQSSSLTRRAGLPASHFDQAYDNEFVRWQARCLCYLLRPNE